MRIFLKIGAAIASVYILFWCALALYFSFAERHKGLLESNLSALFEREVTISEVHTAWRGSSPVIQINGFEVKGDTPELPALAFRTMSAELAPLSLLSFWPKLTEFAVEAPRLEVVSLPNNRLQIAGIVLSKNRSSGISPKRLITWLINHESASWHNGEITWRRPDGSAQRYQDISFVYERQQQNRKLDAAVLTSKGALAVKAESNGNMMINSDWDASLEVLGDAGQRLLSSEDLSLVVEEGRGTVQLRRLNVERVRDFLLLTGLNEAASWIMNARLGGVLNDVQFDFAGPFLAFDEWSLQASAENVEFIPSTDFPGMNRLAGSIRASRDGGTFEFSSDGSTFDWPKIFDQPFAIQQTEGRFRWNINDSGIIDVYLEDAMFYDGTLDILSLDAHCAINTRHRRVGVLADWFTAGPIEDLRFEGGQIVSRSENAALFLTANAEFAIDAFERTARYFPKDERARKLRQWWQNAFLGGAVSQGNVSYEGPISLGAVRDGSARIQGRAEFEDVELDYGFERDWPVLERATGYGTLSNDGITIVPTQSFLGQDKLENAEVSIRPIFEKGRVLYLRGSMATSLPTVNDFLFNGPLLSKEQKALQAGQPLPLTAEAGTVDADVHVVLPLNRVSDVIVNGNAKVRGGRIIIPPGVALDNVNTDMTFTEESATAERITAELIGGSLTASLITTEAAKPPKLKLVGQGRGNVSQLEPWVGEHLLSWVDGVTDWQGEVAIDGGQVTVDVDSNLQGVAVTAPAPLAKTPEQSMPLRLALRTGGGSADKLVVPELAVDYGSHLRVHFKGDPRKSNELLDRGRVVIADDVRQVARLLPPGINFYISQDQLDLDAWLSHVIDLARLETKPLPEGTLPDTSFLDAMRGLKIESPNTQFLSRPYGDMTISAISLDGMDWTGTMMGEHINGALKASPRADVPSYRLNLAHFHMLESTTGPLPPEPIEASLQPSQYPQIELNANTFVMSDKTLGRLHVRGSPQAESWQLDEFSLNNTDISTVASGQWRNTAENGSRSEFSIETKIDEAGDVLDGMQFNDLIRQGNGLLKGNLNWIGAPHEFDFARLNGDFDLQINDGELVQVESGAGRLIGLLNFNTILRRLTLDFRDVFSSGLKFDRMQYAGILAEGKAVMREAFMLSPSVFVRMEGNIDLNNEQIDMEIHASPELGGNLALLSAIANPAAGAVVYLTQRLFKDQMRANSFLSYRAKGSWEDFELDEIDGDGDVVVDQSTSEPEPNLELRPDSEQNAKEPPNSKTVDENSGAPTQ